MFKKIWSLVIFAGFFFTLSVLHADDLQPIPEFNALAIDQTGWLKPEELQALNKRLEGIAAIGKIKVALLMVNSTGQEAVEQYSIRVAEKWQMGKKGVDNGVLMLAARQDKKFRIDVGRGLEGVLPDITVKRIVSETIKPNLNKRPFEAINMTLDKLISYTQQEPATVNNAQEDQIDGLIIVLACVLMVIFISWLLMPRKRYVQNQQSNQSSSSSAGDWPCILPISSSGSSSSYHKDHTEDGEFSGGGTTTDFDDDD